MVGQWEMRWEGELAARPQEVWDALDAARRRVPVEGRVRAAGRRSRARALAGGGPVTGWDPPRRFATRTRPERATTASTRSTTSSSRVTAARYLRYTHRSVVPAGTSTARSTPAATTRPSTSTRSASTRATSPAASRSTSPSTRRRGGRGGHRRGCGEALGLPADVVAGDRVRLTPAGLRPRRRRRRLRRARVRRRAHGRLAVPRSDGRDAWGWPVSIAEHLFTPAVDAAARSRAWTAWLAGLFTTETEEA